MVINEEIYGRRYIGVYYQYKMKFSGVALFKTKSDVKVNVSFENLFFEVSLLREFEGKKDILLLEFEDGTTEYEKLFEPGMYYDKDKNTWEETAYREVPKKFLELIKE